MSNQDRKTKPYIVNLSPILMTDINYKNELLRQYRVIILKEACGEIKITDEYHLVVYIMLTSGKSEKVVNKDGWTYYSFKKLLEQDFSNTYCQFSFDVDERFEELKKKKDESEIMIQHHLSLWKKFTNVYNKLQEKLEKICNHEWEIVRLQFDTIHECKKCGRVC